MYIKLSILQDTLFIIISIMHDDEKKRMKGCAKNNMTMFSNIVMTWLGINHFSGMKQL